jgi:hypothetical protein
MSLSPHLYSYISSELNQWPGNYLEIGVYDGDGFSTIAKNFKEKNCYALDPFIEDGYTRGCSFKPQGGKLISQKESFLNYTKDFQNVILYEESSVEFYNKINQNLIENMSISMILIDGSHHYKDVVNDYKLSLELLQFQGKGVIIFDDLQVSDVMTAFNEFLDLNKNIIVKKGSSGGNSSYVIINYNK